MATDTEAAQLLETLRRLRKDMASTLLIAEETLNYRIPKVLGTSAQKLAAEVPFESAAVPPEIGAILKQLQQEMALLVPADPEARAQESRLLRAEVEKDMEENKIVLRHYDQAISLLESQGAAGVTAAWVILENCGPLNQSL